MFDQLISVLILLLIFACAGWALYAICTHFKLPMPFFWISGAILLILVLVFLGKLITGGMPVLFHR